MQIHEKLHRPDEVAALLGVNKRTVYRMLQHGRIRGIRNGGPVRIPAAEVRRLVGKP
jgi:excisionase family DNA binding protein